MNEVEERHVLWSGVRRAEPLQQTRRIMREKNISHEDLAQRLAVSQSHVSRLLRGTKNIQLDTLYRLADALDVPVTITIGVCNEQV